MREVSTAIGLAAVGGAAIAHDLAGALMSLALLSIAIVMVGAARGIAEALRLGLRRKLLRKLGELDLD